MTTAPAIPSGFDPGDLVLIPHALRALAASADIPIAGVQIVPALTLASAHHPPGSLQQGLLVLRLDDRMLASDVKLTLMNAYPDEHPIILITGVETATPRTHAMPLYELDRKDLFDAQTVLWTPPLPHPGDYEALQEVIAHLRSPEGCPWDREQTHLSLRPYLLEEAYEVLEALDGENPDALVEELGDLLIQAALHIQIATEEGEFKLPDVIEHVTAKLVRRHPHVFGDLEVAGADEVVRNWEAIKQTERQAKQANDYDEDANGKKTLLDGIPTALPALALTQGYIERLTRVGYPLPTAATLDETELGAGLLRLVEQAQVSGLDAESALRRLAETLRARLVAVEAGAVRQGKALTDLDPAQQQALWRRS